jgi:hypothetical protein
VFFLGEDAILIFLKAASKLSIEKTVVQLLAPVILTALAYSRERNAKTDIKI